MQNEWPEPAAHSSADLAGRAVTTMTLTAPCNYPVTAHLLWLPLSLAARQQLSSHLRLAALHFAKASQGQSRDDNLQ